MIISPQGWADFQHYKDRAPPWIRLHRGLIDNFDYQRLPVASKALAPMLWLLAAESKELSRPEIDASPAYLAFRLRMPEADVLPALIPLIENGFFSVLQDASGLLAPRQQVAVPETETETETETERDSSSARADAPPAKPKSAEAKLPEAKAARLRQVTADAVEAFNAALTGDAGVLSRVTLVNETRTKQVQRCIAVAREICRLQFGNATITPEFWKAYFAEVARDPFKSGRQAPGRDHANWKPGFEYLTRPAVMTEVFDAAMSRPDDDAEAGGELDQAV